MRSASSPISRERALTIRPLRVLVQVHRWLGIALCLMFAVWFATGAVMIYVPFPSLAASDRIDHLARIDFSKVTVSPAAALAATGVTVDRLRLIQTPVRPVYLVSPVDGPVVAIGADNGRVLPDIDATIASKIGEQFSGHKTKEVEGPFDYDQWVVHQQFDPARPFFRVAAGDDAETDVYVSARSGDVLQWTTHSQRLWNYVGSVVHWIYPTILRKSWVAWDNVVWYLSLVGIGMAISGITLGLVRSTKSMRNTRRPSISPFRSWFRWHHITGLGVGLILLTWIFSGWLSMDHGRLFSDGLPTPKQIDSYRGITVTSAAQQVSIEQIAALGAISEAEIVALDAQAYLIGRQPSVAAPIIQPLSGSTQTSVVSFPDEAITSGVRAAWPTVAIESVGGIPADDSYGHLITEPLPDATRRVVLGDQPPTWIHVDATTGQIIQVMDRSRRLYRWFFTALHTFDIPGLSGHELLREILMLSLLAFGFLLSVTGVVLGVKRLRRTF